MRTNWIALPFALLTGIHLASAQDSLDDATYELGNVDSVAFESATAECDCGETVGCGTGCDGGGWLGSTLLVDCRSHLQESGITFAGRVTHYAFGIDGGINTPVPSPLGQGDTFKYTGRGEYDFLFDLEKFGGLPHGRLLIRAEHWFGEFGNVSLNSGTLTPPVFPALLPPNVLDEGVPIISNFLFTQPLSERLVVFIGKSDVLGKADQDIFAGGDGTDQFINQALMANPAFLLALPYTSFATGVVMPREWGSIRAFVRDPQGRTKDFFRLKDLFSKGVLAGGQVQVNTNLFNKPGEHHFGGIWKHVALPDLEFSATPPGQYPYPQARPGVARIKDSYTIYYGFDQYVKLYSNEPRRGWGLFGRASISDGNPTPFEYFLSAGIGGDSPFGCQRGDTFGIGWYYNGVSSEFGPVPQAIFGPQDGTGVELYYNFQVTRCINVTPDIQYIKPAASAIADDAFVYGLRINTAF